MTARGTIDLTRVTAAAFVVTGSTAADTVRLAELPANLTLDTRGGTDTVDFSAANAGINLDIDDLANVENINGTSQDDTFIMSQGARLGGTLDGKGGDDEIDYSAFGSAVSTDLGSGDSTGLGGFASIELFTGSGREDTLSVTGSSDDEFVLNENNGGRVTPGAQGAPVDFTSYENLAGGSGDDLFVVRNQSTLSGEFDGGGGSSDRLRLDDTNLTAGQSYTIAENSVSRNPTYGFRNMETLELLLGSGDDEVTTDFFSFAQRLDGGNHGSGDTLNFDAVTAGTTSPATASGVGSVTFTGFENENFRPVSVTEVTNEVSEIGEIDIINPVIDAGGGGMANPDGGDNTVIDNFSSDGGESSETPASTETSPGELLTQTDGTTADNFSAAPVTTDSGAPPPGPALFSLPPTDTPPSSVTPAQSQDIGPVSLGGGPPPSATTQAVMTESVSPQMASDLSTALGGDGSVPAQDTDGAVSLDPSAPPTPPAPATEASLASNVGHAVESELSLALGGDGSVGVSSGDGPTSVTPSGPPPSRQAQASLSVATNTQSAQNLSEALGGEGTAPADSESGSISVDPAAGSPAPQTQTSLGSNVSVGVFGELSGALGGTGESNLNPGEGLVSLDPSGTPPSPQATQQLEGTTGAVVESSLGASLGLERTPIAQSTDGAIEVDAGGGSPAPGTRHARRPPDGALYRNRERIGERHPRAARRLARISDRVS